MPVEYYISDYDDPTAPGTQAFLAAERGDYHYIDGDLHINTSGTVLNGLYYVTGSIHLNGNNLSGNVTFVCRGTIELNGNDNAFTPYCDQLIFFTDLELSGSLRCVQPVISIIGSGNTTLNGVIYAPNGQISVSGSGVMSGSFVADSADLAGSGLSVNLPEPAGYPAGCEAYDVRSHVGETTTQVRLVCCNGVWSVQTWTIE
jgi:hypothetical protein